MDIRTKGYINTLYLNDKTSNIIKDITPFIMVIKDINCPKIYK